jgi:glutamate 5-kinase
MSRKKRAIVIKIGSSCIVQENGRVNLSTLAELAEVIGKLSKLWERVVLVSSGAILLGRHQLGSKIVPQSIAEKQALASVGQLCLMNLYKGFLDQLGVTVGQILVSIRVLPLLRSQS